MTLDEELQALFKQTTGYRWCKSYAEMSDDGKRHLIARIKERIKLDEENKRRALKKIAEEPFPFGGKMPDEDKSYCGGGRRVIRSTKPFS